MSGASGEDLHAKLFEARVLVVKGDLDDAVADRVCAGLLRLAADDPADVFVYLDSPGGLLSAGLAIYDMIKFVEVDVATVAWGMAAGIAQMILSAGTPGKRYALPDARILLTAPTGVAPAAAGGDIVGPIMRLIAEDTGLPFDQVLADAGQGRWFTAQQALASGLVDRILTAPPSATSLAPDAEPARPVPQEPEPTGAAHADRAAALRSAVESAVVHRYPDVFSDRLPAGRRQFCRDLAEALLKAVPEWREVDAAFAGRADAADAAARLRSWLETVPEPDEQPARPSERLSLRGVLQEVADRIDQLPLMGDGDRRLGYEAGLRAARRGVLQRAELAGGEEHLSSEPVLPPGLSVERARPEAVPVVLPDRAEQIERFARVLDRKLAGISAGERAEVAERLLRSVQAPDPDVYARVHRHWTANESAVTDLEERVRARTGLTPDEAHRRREIVRELDDLANSLAPTGTASGGFPAAFETATRRVIAILRSTADRLRPSWTPFSGDL
ncbi:ClpP family protease [Spirillospora sp. CA-142024]|uniref:ClpP family protease n=1 Tax=Spirillospora sp. CA-142024 TaxID=3240036 RepID=UPI003D9239CD